MTLKRRFFTLPNELFILDLSPGEIAVYAYLLFCEDRETYQCWPSFKRIGQCTGMSPNTVRKYVHRLEEKRLIDTENTTVQEERRQSTNGCSFIPSGPSRRRWRTDWSKTGWGEPSPPKNEVIHEDPDMERPGPLFVWKNSVEHMSWGPPMAAQNLHR